MDIALVTGASSALGLAISKRLIQLGFRVYGLGGDYTDCPLQNVNFKPVQCDLADPAAVEAACRRILEKERAVCLIVNNAKYFGRGRFAEMDNADLERILRINLLCPLILVRTLGEGLKKLQGHIIQLGALSVERSRGGPAGAAASGGLRWMSEQLFQDLRDHGVRVCHISPEPNQSRDPRSTPRPGAKTEASIDPEAVAQAVEQLMLSPYGNVVTELVLRPLRQREPEIDPIRRLPHPEPKPIPYTVPREVIDAEEQLEEEAYQAQMERKREKRKARKQARREGPNDKPSDTDDTEADDSPTGDDKQPRETVQPDRNAARPAPSNPADRQPEGNAGGQDGSRSRRRRKPRPPQVQVGFHNHKPADKAVQKSAETQPEKQSVTASESAKALAPATRAPVEEKQSTPPAKPSDSPASSKPAAKKVARKAVKKVAKKAVKKAARKAARKAAKNAPTKRVEDNPSGSAVAGD